MKVCPNPKCSAENRDTAKFCIQCRYYLGEKVVCPKCGMGMDPHWAECAYCKSASSTQEIAAGRLRSTPPPAASVNAAPRPPVGSSGFTANVPPPPPPAGQARRPRDKTKFVPMTGDDPLADNGAVSSPKGAPRRIVGVLITYTWKPEGEVYPVREGRNLIGRDLDQCDIVVKDDPTMSGVNSHITYRRSFLIGDMISLSGTDVNGEPIEEQFCTLYNYSTIRTGSTHWTFIAVQPDAFNQNT